MDWGEESPVPFGKERTSSSWCGLGSCGKGIEFWRKTGGGDEGQGRGRGRRRERNRSAVRCSPFFYFGFRLGCFRVFFSLFFIVLSFFSPSYRRKNNLATNNYIFTPF